MPFDAAPITTPLIETLRKGRARVERGWCQHQSRDGERRCALGALGDEWSTDCMHAVDALRRGGRFAANSDIAEWNDAPERTQADVLALYDKAIELAVQEALTNG